MIKETELKYTVNTLVDLSKYLWGENSTEFLAGALQSVISQRQMVVLIDDLERQVKETATCDWCNKPTFNGAGHYQEEMGYDHPQGEDRICRVCFEKARSSVIKQTLNKGDN